MKQNQLDNHLFWGGPFPLASLSGGALMVIASGRTAFALITAAALLWVYGLTMVVCCFAKPLFPEKGKDWTLVFLSGLLSSLYILIIRLLNPLLAMEVSLYVLLTPVSLAASRLIPRLDGWNIRDALFRGCSEALVLGALIFGLALIREPLGYGSLSLPGGSRGIIEIFNSEDSSLFPVRVISGASGALLLLGYAVAIYRRMRNQMLPGEEHP
ncbi:MAG: hypothetical protein LBT11_00580 [Treponema sp.]|jgi:hypothetical protein|nr:hypothetical protein [Treponema sp.]